jgi:hypothetical protein
LLVSLSRTAEPVAGRIILGKADAADSVPGPGPEKKTENGVWFAVCDSLSEPDPAGKAAEGVEARMAPVPRTLGLVTAAFIFGTANCSGGPPSTVAAAGFKSADAESCPVMIADSELTVVG